jgi:hypothetical protein
MSEISTPAPGAASHDAAWPFPRRFVAVFTSPRALFEHLAERPTWLVPLLVVLGSVALLFAILMDPVIVPEQLSRMEETGQASDQAVAMMQGPLKWSFLFIALLFLAGGTFVYAAAVMAVGSFVLGGRFSYRQALSLVSHASLTLVPASLLAIPLALVTKSIEVSFGPGAFFKISQAEGFFGKFLAYFLFGVDVFRLWQTALIALGVSVIARVASGKATPAIWVLFLAVTLLGAMMQAALALMGGA